MSDITNRWRNARSEIETIIRQVDMKLEKLEAEEKRMENKRDESYIRGAEDMVEAIQLFSNNEESGGMSLDTMKELFGYGNFLVIIENVPPEVIIKKVKQWKEEREKLKETEVKVGDEIEYIRYGKLSEKRIVIRIDDREDDEKIIWTIGLDKFDQYGTSTNDPTEKYHKTGKHYDSIPFPEKGENE